MPDFAYSRVFKATVWPNNNPAGINQFTGGAQPWTKTGHQLGSNKGGVYTRGQQRYYVKFPNAKGQIEAEHVADKLYELLGVGTMKHTPQEVDGKLASVSEWKSVQQLGRGGWATLSPEQQDTAAAAFVASALTKNWDVVGLEYDNMGQDAKGRLSIMDTGGSFQFRAQGEPKDFGPDAGPELKSMLNPARTSGAVFSKLMAKNPASFGRAVERLRRVSDQQIQDAASSMSEDTRANLLARRNTILQWADQLKLPKE